MTFYHGSNCDFDAMDLTQQKNFSPATQFTEGRGFYFSDSIQVAESYGPIVYRVDIPNQVIGDFRKEAEIETALRQMLRSVQLPQEILAPEILKQLKESVLNCDIAVSSLPEALALVLDNDPMLYSQIADCYAGDDLADDFQNEFLKRFPVYLYPVNENKKITFGKVARNCPAIRIEKLESPQIETKGCC